MNNKINLLYIISVFNIIFDIQEKQITINRDNGGRILSVELLNGSIFSINHSTEEEAFYCATLLDPDNKLDKFSAIALVAYLWNKDQIKLSIVGRSDCHHSNISFSYHIILKGMDIFDVILNKSNDISYSIHLSTSEIEYSGLEAIGRCTHNKSDHLSYCLSENSGSPYDSALEIQSSNKASQSKKYLEFSSDDFMGEYLEDLSIFSNEMVNLLSGTFQGGYKDNGCEFSSQDVYEGNSSPFSSHTSLEEVSDSYESYYAQCLNLGGVDSWADSCILAEF